MLNTGGPVFTWGVNRTSAEGKLGFNEVRKVAKGRRGSEETDGEEVQSE